MSFATQESTGQGGHEASSNGGRRSARDRAAAVPGLEPFAVDVERRDDGAIVRPRGDLDIATVATLRAALDGIDGARRLVLDLRGLTFIDSTGLHLLAVLHQRAERDGFLLELVAPAAPLDRAINLSGLNEALPFVMPDQFAQNPSASNAASRRGSSS